MKTILSIALVALMVTGCKKEGTRSQSKECYECNFDDAGWQDMGCMTPDEWSRIQFTDFNGNPRSKSACRTK